jgi:teichuronic acid biosynthesis glycosyltransferase TuaC
MRILTVTNMYPTDADPTFGTFVGDQVAALRAHGRVEACDVMFIDGRSSRWNYLRGFWQLRQQLRRSTYDVIHAHYGLTGAIAVSQRSVPVVVSYHTGDIELSAWQRAISGIAARLAQANICVSQRAMRHLPRPAHYLPCGLDLDAFLPADRAKARERYGIDEAELAILFPSSPDRVKKAYPRFVQVREELRRRGHQVHELQLRGTQRSQVPELLAAADVMVLVSTQEGSPVAVMEAMASGLPVVATPVGDVAHMLEGVVGAHVEEFEAGSFAASAERLADAAPTRRAPFERAKLFDQNVVIDRLLEILDDASSRTSSSLAAR